MLLRYTIEQGMQKQFNIWELGHTSIVGEANEHH